MKPVMYQGRIPALVLTTLFTCQDFRPWCWAIARSDHPHSSLLTPDSRLLSSSTVDSAQQYAYPFSLSCFFRIA
ncbi:MAG: hypothetical protein WBA57_00460 [Elainellaceae cyanobacterium]